MNSNNSMPTCLPASSIGKASESRAPNQQVLRVLLLEDNLELAELLRLIFETSGLQATVAHLGRVALRLLEQEEFDLAMVDIDLPDTTGFQVVAGALARGRLQNTKIIFFSGGPTDERVAMARLFPGSLFVPKPFEMQCLLSLIRKLFPTCQY